MKTLRDNNNNNSSSNTPSGHLSSLNRSNLISSSNPSEIIGGFSSSSSTSNFLKDHQGSFPTAPHSFKTNSPTINPYAPLFNADMNQFTASIQSYLNNPQKFQPSEMINPFVYLQFLNNNAVFMQQLAALQTMTNPTNSSIDPTSSPFHYAAKARPMSQEELAEHARSIYQRALQRNQLQQQNDLMKHFYESLHAKHQDLPTTSSSSMSRMHYSNNNYHDVPSVPNVSHIGNEKEKFFFFVLRLEKNRETCVLRFLLFSASAGTFDVLDTMIQSNGSPSSCLSVKEQSLETAISSLSLLSADETKIISNKSSTLDPSAPIFIPRHSGTQFDEDQDTVNLLSLTRRIFNARNDEFFQSSSSSDSDFNDFHYLDQFLDEFYPSDRQQDNHLILHKTSLSDSKTNPSTSHLNSLGQGDNNDDKSFVSSSMNECQKEKSSCQYSIYQLLNR